MTLFDLGPEPGPDRGPATTTAEAPAQTVRLRLELAYDGSGFRGFAAQAGQRTVAGELAEAISKVVRHPVQITCAGRTDAGVHALGQVVHVDVGEDVEVARLVKAVNAMLAPAVVVRRGERAEVGFDARRSARARHYRYLVLETDSADPLLAPVSWQVNGPLDLRAMAAGADTLVGEHDFRAFCRRPPGTEAGEPIVRRVVDAAWSEARPRPDGLAPHERLLRFDVSANAFCHQMVRTMVGMLVEVGRGRRRPSDLVWLLRSGDRTQAISLAPPHGLCLVRVDY